MLGVRKSEWRHGTRPNSLATSTSAAAPVVAVGAGRRCRRLEDGRLGDCVLTVDMLIGSRRFRVAGSIPVGGPQGAGGQLERSGGHGSPAVGRRRGPALPRQAQWTWPWRSTKACCRWPNSMTWPSPAATQTVGRPLVMSITLIGASRRPRPVCRGGARPGDRILATG